MKGMIKMKNFAMIYKMKESLHEYRTAFNKLDPEWQEWIANYFNKKDLSVRCPFDVYNILEDLQMNELDIEPYEIEVMMEVREQE